MKALADQGEEFYGEAKTLGEALCCLLVGAGKTLEDASPARRSARASAGAHPSCEAAEVRAKKARQVAGRLTEYDIMVVRVSLFWTGDASATRI